MNIIKKLALLEIRLRELGLVEQADTVSKNVMILGPYAGLVMRIIGLTPAVEESLDDKYKGPLKDAADELSKSMTIGEFPNAGWDNVEAFGKALQSVKSFAKDKNSVKKLTESLARLLSMRSQYER